MIGMGTVAGPADSGGEAGAEDELELPGVVPALPPPGPDPDAGDIFTTPLALLALEGALPFTAGVAGGGGGGSMAGGEGSFASRATASAAVLIPLRSSGVMPINRRSPCPSREVCNAVMFG